MPNWHDARGPAEKLIAQRWRIGGSVGRTIYVCEGHNAPADTLIGLVDSQELAEHIVAVHNASLDRFGVNALLKPKSTAAEISLAGDQAPDGEQPVGDESERRTGQAQNERCALCGNVHDPSADCPVRSARIDGLACGEDPHASAGPDG